MLFDIFFITMILHFFLRISLSQRVEWLRIFFHISIFFLFMNKNIIHKILSATDYDELTKLDWILFMILFFFSFLFSQTPFLWIHIFCIMIKRHHHHWALWDIFFLFFLFFFLSAIFLNQENISDAFFNYRIIWYFFTSFTVGDGVCEVITFMTVLIVILNWIFFFNCISHF